MGLEAVYPKPNLSKANPAHKIYAYLLRGVKIEQVNQVWSTDMDLRQRLCIWVHVYPYGQRVHVFSGRHGWTCDDACIGSGTPGLY
jgi:hypothetical protein